MRAHLTTRRALQFIRAMRNLFTNLIAASLLLASTSCLSKQQGGVPKSEPTPTPVSQSQQADITWPSDPTKSALDSVALKRAWDNFEQSQPYRLAQPSDRRLSPAAIERVNTNNPKQVVPFIAWWGVRGLRNSSGKDILVAIVVDPGRSDQNRYGLVVIASPESEKGAYKVYWVAREEDMESYLISPASGSIYIECFRRDGSEQTKELAYDGKARRFKLM